MYSIEGFEIIFLVEKLGNLEENTTGNTTGKLIQNFKYCTYLNIIILATTSNML